MAEPKFKPGDIVALKPANTFPEKSRNRDINLRDQSLYLVEDIKSGKYALMYTLLELSTGKTWSFSTDYIEADYQMIA